MLLELAKWDYVILYGVGIIWNKINYKKHRFSDWWTFDVFVVITLLWSLWL
jgi:hypothetical protein